MNKKCLLFVDSGAYRGLGHLMRSLALGQELRQKDFSVQYFIEDDIETINLIKAHNFLYQITGYEKLEKQETFLKRKKPDIIITDLFNPSAELLATLKKYCDLLVSIDDFNLSQYCSDIIINPNFFCCEEDYRKSAKNSKVFCGSKYYIMDEEFRKLHLEGKKIEPAANNILVTFGGNDPNNSTLKIIEALCDLNKVRIISSYKIFQKDNQGEQQLKQKKTLETKPNVKIYDFIENMSEQMFNSDIIFCGGGSTIYQAACIGTPIITMPQAEFELQTSSIFEQKQIAFNLGHGKNVTKNEIRNAYLELRNNKERRSLMCKNGKKEIDGRGTKLVAQLIIEEMK